MREFGNGNVHIVKGRVNGTWMVLGQFLTWNHPSSSFFFLYFNLNKWFSHRSWFFSMISSSKCGGLLFVILCGVVWFPVSVQCSFDSYWNIDYSIKDLGVNVADPEAMDIPVTLTLSYIFVGIMLLYAINLDAVSLFADSSFTFLAVLNDVISRFEWMNIILFLPKIIIIIIDRIQFIHLILRIIPGPSFYLMKSIESS